MIRNRCSRQPPSPRVAVPPLALLATTALLALTFPVSLPAHAETAQQVLEHNRQALGGEKALSKSTSMVYKGTQSHQGFKRTFSWSVLAPSFFREDTAAPGIKETVATDGKNAWTVQFNGVAFGLQGPDRDAARIMDLLMNRSYLQPEEVDLTVGTATKSPDGSRWVVPFSGRNLPKLELSFDAKSWQLVRAYATSDNGYLAFTFDQVQKAGDLRLPFRIERTSHWDNVDDSLTYVIEDVDRKAELEEGLFERPGETRGTFRLPEGQTAATLPITYHEASHHLFLQASINGSEPQLMMLDSGANATVLDTTLVAKLNLPVIDKVMVGGAGGSEMASLHSVERIGIGQLELTGTVVVSSNLAPFAQALKLPLAGILGMEVFDRLVVELRYADGTVTFHAPAAYTDTGTGEALPLDPLNRVNALINGHTLLSVLPDTGSGAALNLAPATVRRENLAPPEDRRLPLTVSGMGGQVAAYLGGLESVQLGQLSVPQVPAVFHETSAGVMAGDDGISVIGNQLLQRFNVTFDYPRRQLILEPGAWFSRPFPYNRSGLSFKAGPDRVVERVRGDGQGIQAGDRVLAVMTDQGWSAEPSVIDARLQEAPGTKVKLKIKRDDKEVVKEIELKELL